MPAPVQPNPFLGQNPVVNSLFRNMQMQKQQQYNQMLKRGTLISFNYQRWIHDPYPLLIVTDVWPGYGIRGVNLHYCTFPYIRTLLRSGCNSPAFSYRIFKGDLYIVSAFRSYKWQAIRQVKTLDCSFLLQLMATARTFNPQQIREIRENVRRQIQKVVNAKALPTGEIEM